jgi:16S rRNA (cytidine1402-2'-O)-methyltransferase
VHPVPGPSALTALISASGLPSDRVLFIGFLPTKTVALKQEMLSWLDIRASIVFFESTRRLGEAMKVLAETLPLARVCIGRELTKLYEEIHTFSVNEALVWCSSHESLKGEAVVMVDLSAARKNDNGFSKVDLTKLTDEARKEFKHGATLKDLLQKYKDCGLSRSALYQLLLAAKSND